MTPLAALLIKRIVATGPITLADYIADCLMHPQHGYYATRDPFGQAGDFTTAPEISQMFGEMLGLCLAQAWLDQGAPAAFTLAELGPGRGTLMADVLRATRGIAGFHAAANVILVETSAKLRAIQQNTLANRAVTWLASAQDLPDAPLFLMANEFFDALPIRQFSRHENGWCETMIGVRDSALCFGKAAPSKHALLDHRLADTTPGEIVEICPAAGGIIAAINARVTAYGGLALIVDYGSGPSRGDTFQAMRAHAYTDPLTAPGEADLTAHVDFAALAAQSNALSTTQGALLTALGIQQRSTQLAQRLTGAALESHFAATRRLTAPEEMGELFKALAVFPINGPKPPGFL